MKRPAERLASLQFTTVILIVLMFWFAWGIVMAESDRLTEGFRVMNSLLAPEWFAGSGNLPFLLKLWFVGVCAVMTVLGINLIFCSWIKILRLMRSRQAASKLIMLVIHVVFGLVALGHFGSFVLGYRYEHVTLREGQTFPLPEGYAVAVRAIHVEDHPILFERPKERRAGAFDPKANFCEVALMHNGTQVGQGPVYFLRPFVWKDIQVTLKRFTLLKGTKSRDVTDARPGVRLIVSRNPVRLAVFILFPIMIGGIGIYMLMTWRPRPNEKGNS